MMMLRLFSRQMFVFKKAVRLRPRHAFFEVTDGIFQNFYRATPHLHSEIVHDICPRSTPSTGVKTQNQKIKTAKSTNRKSI